MRCVDCGIYEALPEDELCEECLERNTTDTVIYKIPWQKYDPENPPEMHRLYIICTNNVKPPKMSIAQLSESPSERIMWLTPNGFIADRVTHYAPINLPEGEG